MNRLVWIVTIPIAIAVVLFAVVNRNPVALSLWPLPWDIEAPLFLFTLGTIVFGFLFGAAVTWISGGTTRQKLRAAQRDLAHAQDELVAVKRQQGVSARPNNATPPTALPPAA
ncbi:lipopolysaccharide assembly protein LapA domain-containing protein [Dongia sp.]|uniref:lipopolysaccharide assembly protein LapA domain-containing protein n=1 Tax=Dongia sp. TaxID=1977262 RepID=UPI0035B1DE29